MNVERLILKYESMTDEKNHLPEDLKATIIIELCHRDLREHLELSTDQTSYNKVRTEILNYVERKRDTVNNDIKAMEVDHLDSDYHYGDWDWWEDDAEYEQLNYFQKGGKGGKGGKGKGYYYGGKGGYEKGKGKGKGFEDRGGKGGYDKGKGKGKGFQGECNWCGTWGHTASKCMKKDRHMQEYRQANGIPEPVWPPTGKGGLHSFEDIAEKPTKPTKSTTSESPEMALDAMQSLGGYRLLCSLDSIPLRNRMQSSNLMKNLHALEASAI